MLCQAEMYWPWQRWHRKTIVMQQAVSIVFAFLLSSACFYSLYECMTAAGTVNHALLWVSVIVIRCREGGKQKAAATWAVRLHACSSVGGTEVQCSAEAEVVTAGWQRGGQLLCVLLRNWRALLPTCFHSMVLKIGSRSIGSL